MDQGVVSLLPSAHRPKHDTEPSDSSLNPHPNQFEPSPEISGGDTEKQHEETIYAQLLEVLSKLQILVNKTRPIQSGIDPGERARWSEEQTSVIHTTLDFFRLDMHVWLDDISNITANLRDAFEILAGRDVELNQTLRTMLHGILQHIASVEEMIDSDTTGPSRTARDKYSDVLAFCDNIREYINHLQNLKRRLQKELGSIFLEGGQQDKAIVDYPPSILCLDGGGVRSFISLIILRKLMIYVHAELEGSANLPTTPAISPLKPCDIFDFIFGSSSGGLLAIMLGRLEMTIDECFDRFHAYGKEIFSHPKPFSFLRFLTVKYSDERLIRGVRHIVGDFDPSPDSEKWRRTIFKDTSGRCKTGVLAYATTPRDRNGSGPSGTPYMIRSYDCEPRAEPKAEPPRFPALNPGPASSFQIWEAARATTAAPRYFKPLNHENQEFYDGGITSNNPTLQVLGEMQALLPHHPINCVVSVGSGITPPNKSAVGWSDTAIRLLTTVVTDTQDIERLAFAIADSREFPYFRFNPELQRRIAIDEWNDRESSSNTRPRTLDYLEKAAEEFLSRDEIGDSLRRCAEILAHQADRRRAKDTVAASYGNVHWVVPRTINDLFTGRSELLFRIENVITSGQTSSSNKQKRFVITGPGGQGKSEICLKVASQLRERFWGIFWVDVGNASTAERDFVAIATLLGRPVKGVSEALQVLASTKQDWLLILDNADDPNFDYQAYFPSGSHGAVLMTSRVSECKRYSLDAFEVLGGLDNRDARELLLKAASIPEESWSSYDDEAEKVVNLLGSYTLALIQAGAYITKGHCQLYEYPRVYQNQRQRLLRYRPEQARSRYHDIYTTFEASAEVLKQSESEAAKDSLHLLAILSMLDSAILPLQIFQSAWNGGREVLCASPEEASEMDALSQSHVLQLPSFLVVGGDEWDPYRLLEAISKLSSLSIITCHDIGGSGGLSMHPLAHAWAKDRQDQEQQRIAWVAAGCVLALSRPNSTMWQTQERRLLPHIQSYLDIETRRVLSFGSEALIVPILLKCGRELLNMRQDSKLSHLLKDIFTGLNKNPEEPSKESLPLYELEARSLLNIGKNKEAVKLLEQVVKIKRTTLAADHPSQLASQHALASAYQANGQVKEAVELLEQVVKIQGTTLAADHQDRLASQHALAVANDANGQVKEAVELLEQVVQIKGTMLAADHPDRLASQHALARAYEDNGQIVEAVALLEQVVAIRKTTLAETHPDRLASQHALAIAYEANGQVAEAVTLLEQVVAIRTTTLAETHPDRLASQHALAIAYRANGQVTKAIKLLEQVVAIRTTTLAETHPDRLASQHELAITYRANGQVTEAVKLLEQVVAIERLNFHKGHPSRVISEDAC